MGSVGVCHICAFYFSMYPGETKVKTAAAEKFLNILRSFKLKSCNTY
jgi:hypothetical protein